MSVELKTNSIESLGSIKNTAGILIFSFDSSGRVQQNQRQYISGRPYGSGGSIATGFGTLSNNGMSFASNRVTVPYDGIYSITFNTICTRTSGRRDTNIKINGTDRSNALDEDNLEGYSYRGMHLLYYCNANDYIEWYNQSWYTNGSDTWQTGSVVYLG